MALVDRYGNRTSVFLVSELIAARYRVSSEIDLRCIKQTFLTNCDAAWVSSSRQTLPTAKQPKPIILCVDIIFVWRMTVQHSKFLLCCAKQDFNAPALESCSHHFRGGNVTVNEQTCHYKVIILKHVAFHHIEEQLEHIMRITNTGVRHEEHTVKIQPCGSCLLQPVLFFNSLVNNRPTDTDVILRLSRESSSTVSSIVIHVIE